MTAEVASAMSTTFHVGPRRGNEPMDWRPRRQSIGSLPRRGPTWKVVLIALATSAVIGAISGYAYRYALTRAAEPMPRSGDTVRGAARGIVGECDDRSCTPPS